ncbi:MAG: hypothetical protein ACFCVF_08220 [Kineosporiaceae bacterium]
MTEHGPQGARPRTLPGDPAGRPAAGWRGVVATSGGRSRPGSVAGVVIVDVSRPAALALALDGSGDVARDGLPGGAPGDRPGDEVRGEPARDVPVIVVHRAADEHDARVAASVLVGHRPRVPVALVSTAHAPLAAILALAAAGRLTRDAGHGVTAVHDLLSASWSAVVTPSVAGLDHPAPTVAQHLRSWWPGSRFVVRLGPRPRIVSATRPLLALDGSPANGRTLHATSPTEEDPVTRALASWTATKSVHAVALPDGMPPPLGLRVGDQLALLPTEPAEFVRRAGAPCPTCGLATSGEICDFCRTTLPGRRVRHGRNALAGSPAGSLAGSVA